MTWDASFIFAEGRKTSRFGERGSSRGERAKSSPNGCKIMCKYRQGEGNMQYLREMPILHQDGCQFYIGGLLTRLHRLIVYKNNYIEHRREKERKISDHQLTLLRGFVEHEFFYIFLSFFLPKETNLVMTTSVKTPTLIR